MEDGSSANDSQIETANPNELGTEMSEAEEQAFVDKTLGITPKAAKDDTKADDKADDDKGGEEDKAAADKAEADKKAADEKAAAEAAETPEAKAEREAKEKEAADKKAAEDAKAELIKPEEEKKPVEIADVQTDDLWIEVEANVADAEGNLTPEKIKITVDSGVPENVRFKNDKQLYEVIDAVNEMRGILAQRTEEHDKAIEDQKAEESKAEAQAATMAGWDAEIDQLIEAELLDAPKAKPGEEGFAEDPSVVKIDQTFKYMMAENEKRVADGKAPIKSFTTAYNMWQKTQTAQEDAAKAKEAEEKAAADAKLAKERGALVGGGHSGGSGGKEAPVYKRGSASSIFQVDTSDL